MKKLLLLLFSLMLSLNSLGETIYCSYIMKNGEINLFDYRRDGDTFTRNNRFKNNDILFEDDEYLTLIEPLSSGAVGMFFYDKVSGDFRSGLYSSIKFRSEDFGKCSVTN